MWRQNLKENPAKYNKYLENERLWKNYSNLMKSQKSLDSSSSSNSQTPEANHKTSLTKWIGFLNQTIQEPKFEKGSRSSAAKPKKKVEIVQNLERFTGYNQYQWITFFQFCVYFFGEADFFPTLRHSQER